MRTSERVAILAITLVVLVGCFSQVPDPGFYDRFGRAYVDLVVHSNHFDAKSVDLYCDGRVEESIHGLSKGHVSRERIELFGSCETTFVSANAAGAHDYWRSQSIHLRSGDELHVYLEPNPGNSSISLYEQQQDHDPFLLPQE